MNLLRQTTQRLTAAIAILAVLLLFVAPVISESLAQPMMMPEMAMSQADQNIAMSHHANGDHAEMMNHSSMAGSGFTCGYCDLLVHVPLLLFLFIPFIWLLLLLSRAPPLLLVPAPILRPIAHIYHPRAPPRPHFAICFSA